MTKFLEEDNVPIEFFPGTMRLDGTENYALFTLESDRNSPIYRNNERDFDTMFQATLEICVLLNRGISLTPAQIADYIYGSGSFPNQ